MILKVWLWQQQLGVSATKFMFRILKWNVFVAYNQLINLSNYFFSKYHCEWWWMTKLHEVFWQFYSRRILYYVVLHDDEATVANKTCPDWKLIFDCSENIDWNMAGNKSFGNSA